MKEETLKLIRQELVDVVVEITTKAREIQHISTEQEQKAALFLARINHRSDYSTWLAFFRDVMGWNVSRNLDNFTYPTGCAIRRGSHDIIIQTGNLTSAEKYIIPSNKEIEDWIFSQDKVYVLEKLYFCLRVKHGVPVS